MGTHVKSYSGRIWTFLLAQGVFKHTLITLARLPQGLLEQHPTCEVTHHRRRQAAVAAAISILIANISVNVNAIE